MAHEAKQKAQNALIFLDIQQPLQRNKHQILQALETKAARKPNLPQQNVLNPDGPLLQALDQRINAYKKVGISKYIYIRFTSLFLFYVFLSIKITNLPLNCINLFRQRIKQQPLLLVPI